MLVAAIIWSNSEYVQIFLMHWELIGRSYHLIFSSFYKQLRNNVVWLNVSMSSISKQCMNIVHEPQFQVQHRQAKKETMLELPKRDLKELPGWAMHVLRVLHSARIRSWISNLEHGSAMAALKVELREGAATLLTNPESKR